MMIGLGFLEAYYIFGYVWFLCGFVTIAIMGIKNAVDLIGGGRKKEGSE